MTARAAPVRPTGFDPRWLPLAVTTVGSFMSVLDTSIVNIALPSILKDFGASIEEGQLVITSYLMALAVVIPASGFLAERVGMKRLYIITLISFTVGSALCGMAWNVQSLTFFRVLQGLGGGMIQPLGMAIVFTLITPLERPYFMGLLGIPVLLGPVLGPSLGGYLTEYASWRAIFLINVPIGLIDLGLAIWLLKETPIRHTAKLDTRGFVLSAITFPSLVLALSWGAQHGWGSPLVLALLAVGLVGLTLFVRHELGHREPMLQLRLFSDPMFRLAVAVQWIGFFSLFGLNYLLPLFLEFAHGWSAAKTGMALLPMGIVAFVTMNLAGRAYNRVGPKVLSVAGLGVLLATTFLWGFVDERTPLYAVMILVGGRGLALGLFSQTVQMVAYNTVPEGQMPRATALVNTGQRINGAIATAIVTTVLVFSLRWHGAPEGTSITSGTAPLSFMLRSFRDAFWLMTGLSTVGLALSFFLHDRVLVEWRERAARGEVSHGRSEVRSEAQAGPAAR
ncbi:MAG: MDR family MFS transporter [Dehalococcoidia bacterium]